MELYANVKNRFQRVAFAKVLTAIVAATVDATKGFETILKTQFDKMYAADSTLLEGNAASITGDGDKATIQVRATTAGVQAVTAAPPIVDVVRAPIVKGNFQIESGMPVPEIRRGGDRTNAYPFEQLEIGQSFFVPNTVEVPNPAKTLGSTVSSATRRYKTENPPRVFTIRGNEKGKGADGSEVLGARVWRVAPATATAAQSSGENPAASA
jgi:hypothetical protein